MPTKVWVVHEHPFEYIQPETCDPVRPSLSAGYPRCCGIACICVCMCVCVCVCVRQRKSLFDKDRTSYGQHGRAWRGRTGSGGARLTARGEATETQGDTHCLGVIPKGQDYLHLSSLARNQATRHRRMTRRRHLREQEMRPPAKHDGTDVFRRPKSAPFMRVASAMLI